MILSSTNLINSNANNLSFSIVLQPTTILWADPAGLPTGGTRFYRPGTASVSATEVFVRLSQKAVIKSLAIGARVASGGTSTDTWAIRKNGVDTPLTVSLTGAQTSNINNNVSVTFQAGDSISLKLTASTGSNITDTVIQVDVF